MSGVQSATIPVVKSPTSEERPTSPTMDGAAVPEEAKPGTLKTSLAATPGSVFGWSLFKGWAELLKLEIPQP